MTIWRWGCGRCGRVGRVPLYGIEGGRMIELFTHAHRAPGELDGCGASLLSDVVLAVDAEQAS